MKRLMIDGRRSEMDVGCVGDLLNGRAPGTIAVVNGRHVGSEHHLKDGDSVYLIDGGAEFVNEVAESILADRYTPSIHKRISEARIGIAGLGGIGSHVAEALARAGIGHLVIADFDTVDMTNLNRQNYSVKDVGRAKSDATYDIIKGIRPDADIVPYIGRIDETNASEVFGGCDIVCEAFDDPVQKAVLIETLLSKNPEIVVVSCSGMAGFGSSNTITTERRMSRLYVCGDGESDAENGAGLVASRVMVCAGHVANMAVRIVLGTEEP